MKYLSLAIISITLFFSFSAIASNSEERKLGSFNNITIEDGITVVLIHSDKNRAVITADGVDVSEVVTDLSVFSLTVKLKNYAPDVSVTVEIYYTDELDALTTESGVNVISRGKLYADKLSVNARFGGTIRIEIEAKEIEIQAAGATVTVTGSVKDLDIHALKNAYVDCSNLTYQSKDVTESGSTVKLKE